MSLTPVVLLLTTPMASSSAIIAEIVVASVSPGMAIISSPTEQTAVSASSFSIESAPTLTASFIQESSLTGMKVPLKPPTFPDAIAPPFFTASIRRASAAVLPGPPFSQHPSFPLFLRPNHRLLWLKQARYPRSRKARKDFAQALFQKALLHLLL